MQSRSRIRRYIILVGKVILSGLTLSFVVLGLSLLLPGEASSESGAANADILTWQTECVDCPKFIDSMTSRSLRVDSQDHLHIAYGGDHLYYAYFDGADWHHETVDPSPGVGTYASLVLDQNDDPHISYIDDKEENLKYAYKDIAGWHILTLDSSGDCRGDTSIDVDDGENFSISYIHYEAPDYNPILMYLHGNKTQWEIVTLGGFGGSHSLQLDQGGFPHISYSGKTSVDYGGLVYRYQDASGWHLEDVDYLIDDHVFVQAISLSLDQDDTPHIAYYDDTNYQLKYAKRGETGWTVDILKSFGGSLSSVELSMDLDPQDWPRVIFFENRIGYGNSWFAYFDDSDWHVSYTQSASEQWYKSLAIDSEGNNHVSLFSPKSGNLICDGDIVDSGSLSGLAVSLVFDDNANPHVSYSSTNDSPINSILYGYRDENNWHILELASEGQKVSDLVLDQAGYPHLIYNDSTLAGADDKYAYQDDFGWHIEAVPGRGNELFIEDTGLVHMSYCVSGLHYSYRDTTGWHEIQVDDTVPCHHTDIALDSNGYIHIAYVNSAFLSGESSVRYALRDATGWHTQVVDDSCREENPAIAIGSQNILHLAYMCNGDTEIRYAYRNGAEWQITTLVSGDDVELGGIVVDYENYPHISFASGNSDSIKYAFQDASGWHMSTVSNTGWGYSSIAIRPDGQIGIAFEDNYLKDLKFAEQAVIPATDFVFFPLIVK